MPSDLIDLVMPRHRVHLLGGVSDAGKTRLIVPTMLDWERGLRVFGRESHPAPWAYVSGDRALQEAYDSISSMGLDPSSVRIIPAFGSGNKNLRQIFEAAAKLDPLPELLVIEGFSDLSDGDRRQEIRAFLSNANAYCQPSTQFPAGMTILGIVESPKLKPKEKYSNPRQRISGVSSWGHHTSTVLLLENVEEDPAYETGERLLWLCIKNGRRTKLAAQFNALGQLRIVESSFPGLPPILVDSPRS